MHINTKYRLLALIYLTAAFAAAIPIICIIVELVIGGALIDIWKGEYSFWELLAHRKALYFKLCIVGGLTGLAYWFAFYRNYRYLDPFDKYFK